MCHVSRAVRARFVSSLQYEISELNDSFLKVMAPRKKTSGGGGGCRIRSIVVREFLAEFLGMYLHCNNILTDNVCHLVSGTFVLVVFGTASIAQSVLSLRTKGNFLTINFG